MATSTQQITTWLTKLRLVHEPHAKRSVDAIDLQNSIYADALRNLDPRWLSAAVDWFVREGEKFPKPIELRRKAEELEVEADRARTRPQAAAAIGDPGAALRNEVICLLGDFDNAARRHFGGGIDSIAGTQSPEYRQFLNDAAVLWSGQRPHDEVVNGLLTTGYDIAVRGRRMRGVAASLQAWAATRLRHDDPVNGA
jgi:hypothetical protein